MYNSDFSNIEINKKRKVSPVLITFANLTYTVKTSLWAKERKTLLKDVSGRVLPGQLTAVMGASGSGKSTLLNLLAGYRTSCGGEILVNGVPRDMRRFRKLSCYIMQDSELLPYLTVDEAMNAAACLKLGEKVPPDERQSVVQEVLVSLGLVECRATLTSLLSGGQRKRLCIAQELVSNPPAMFLDEPTSGLDSSSVFQCVSLLKSLAQGGRTVVCSIHQPSAKLLEMFDHLYILADGHCVYRGSIPGLLPFVSAATGLQCPPYHNPADFVMEVASGEHGDDAVPQLVAQVFAEAARSSSKARSLEATWHDTHEAIFSDKKDEAASSSFQFRVILRRIVINTVRNPLLSYIRLASYFIVALLFGAIFYQKGDDASRVVNNASILIMCVITVAFGASMPNLLIFRQDREVIIREYFNSYYSLLPYYLARSLADLPFLVTFTAIFTTLMYFFTGQPADLSRFLIFFLIFVLSSLNGEAVGHLIGSLVSVKVGVFVGPVVYALMVILCGFFITYSSLPRVFELASYFSYLRHQFEGMMVVIYGNGREKLECSEQYCHFRNPYSVLKQFEITESNVWVSVAALVAILVVMRVITYMTLRFNIRRG